MRLGSSPDRDLEVGSPLPLPAVTTRGAITSMPRPQLIGFGRSRRRKHEFFLPSFGAHLPDVPIPANYDLVFYPVPNTTPGGFDLEYTSLLLADGLVMDTASYEFINRQKKPYFSEMRRTVAKLGDAGRLRLENFATHAAEIESIVRQCTDRKLNDHASWIGPVRREWEMWKPTLRSHLKILGQYKQDLTQEWTNYGILCHLTKTSGRIVRHEVDLLTRLLESRRTQLSKGENDVVRELARPYLSQAIFNQILSQKLELPFIDWSDLEPFHRRISLGRLIHGRFKNLEGEHLDKSRQLFELGLNQLRPASVDEVLRFMKNSKAVRSFRHEIQNALVNNTVPDDKWVSGLKDDAVFAGITYRNRQQRYRWISRMTAPIPVVAPLVIHAQELVWGLVDLARDVSAELVDGQAEHTSLKRYEWYYALVEMSHERRAKAGREAIR